MSKSIFLSCILYCYLPIAAQKVMPVKPRILVSTDIAGPDSDDNQSIIHFLIYSNMFKTEGLISSPSSGHGTKQNILEVLDYPGARQMVLMRRLEANDFQTLVPDPKIILDGPQEGPSKVKAILAKDSSRIVVYSTHRKSFTIDQLLIKTPMQKQSWFEPRYGAIYTFRTNQTEGYQTFTPPTSDNGQDWVLIIEGIH